MKEDAFKKFIIAGFILSLFLFLLLPKTNAATGGVVINEVEYDPRQSGTDTAYEWFEIYNYNDDSIILSGWTIADGTSSDIIPDLTIGAHDFAIVAASTSFNENYNPEGLNIVYLGGSIGNGLSNTGDRLILKNNQGEVVDQLSYGSDTSVWNPAIPDVAEGHSIERCPYGRDTDSPSDFIDQRSPTPGIGILPNQPPVANAGNDQRIILGQTVSFNSSNSYDPDGQIVSYYWDFGDGEDSDEANPTHLYNGVGRFTVTLEVTDDSGATAQDQVIITVDWPSYSSDVVINELLPNPGGEESTDEYIELWNKGDTPVDLAGWKLADKGGSYYVISPKHFATTIIPPKGYFILYRDITNIALNNSGGETLYLYSPDGLLKDSVSYVGSAPRDYSYNRLGDSWQWSSSLTPGAANIITANEATTTAVKSLKPKTTTAKKSTSSSAKVLPSVLGARNAAAFPTNSPFHFSDKVGSAKVINPNSRWRLALWFLMIGSFAALVIFRLFLWRRANYVKNNHL